MNTWEQAWLAYQPFEEYEDKAFFSSYYTEEKSILVESGIRELETAASSLFQIKIKEEKQREKAGICLEKNAALSVGKEGYQISCTGNQAIICSPGDKGLLYGIFTLILKAAAGERLKNLQVRETPANPLRMLNLWDNIDGSIERGYSGNSFLYKEGKICVTPRIRDFARLMASVGINGISVNNVNVRDGAEWLITEKHRKELKETAKVLEAYGISMYLCIDFAAPITVGGLDTSDPLDDRVRQWWKDTCRELFLDVPNLGGFLVKADSEGRPGPFAYGRNHADGANMLAEAVEPYGGTIIWRCFVYNCKQDWRDLKTDRAKAGYDNFMPLDGRFASNVVLQIKNGPIDFQVREPVHPLFGHLEHTNQILEVQAAQEYTGQQIDVCYLVPMWKEVLDFSTGCGKERDTVADIVSGRTFGQETCGMAAVSNTGEDANWTGHDLAAANFFGFGRLAWKPGEGAEQIARDWTALQISRELPVIDTVTDILLKSREVYEKYTAPLGIGFMVNPSYHYGPNPEGYEYSPWGTYHRADHLAIGVDRTQKGTGYTEQYFEKNGSIYRNPETCPQNLLLFFHRLPYTYVLPSGKTLIQHVYDTHFEGYEDVVRMEEQWLSLEGKVSSKVFERVKERFALQKENSRQWRDVINSFFYRKSMIPDEKGRKLY